jgi:hypothetical protein
MLVEEYRKECAIELQFLAEIVQAAESLLEENPEENAPLKDRAASNMANIKAFGLGA